MGLIYTLGTSESDSQNDPMRANGLRYRPVWDEDKKNYRTGLPRSNRDVDYDCNNITTHLLRSVPVSSYRIVLLASNGRMSFSGAYRCTTRGGGRVGV